MIPKVKIILWLGIKELRSLKHDTVVVVFLIYSFTLAAYVNATAMSEDVHHASIAFVDDDGSTLSRRIIDTFYPPSFLKPRLISGDEVDEAMDRSRFMFIVSIPPRFEADVIRGRAPELQLNIDATAIRQAGIGAGYITSIVTDEVSRFASRALGHPTPAVQIATRAAFNPNLASSWFHGIIGMINNVTMLTMILTGAALIREREHGTIEHLLVMPLTGFEIVIAKVWSNGLVILVAVAFSLVVVVRGLLAVPLAGSLLLYLCGTVLYLFFATALGIFLGTVARTMGQFALLIILSVMVLQLLSGGSTPVESQPEWMQGVTWFLPSRHYVSFSQAILFRGTGLRDVWTEFAAVSGLGLAFFLVSLALFRRSVAVTK